MKSVVLGKVIENVYSVDTKTKTIKDEHGEEKVVYTAKPVLNKEEKVKEWRYILHFEGEPRYNKKILGYFGFGDISVLNISEDEEVCVKKEIFRADLNELHLYSNKVMEEIDVDKENSTYEYEAHIEQFNKMMNTSNKAMQDYCDLHELDYRKADCEKVFSLVYPDKEYEIKDGKMICKTSYTILDSGYYAIGSDLDSVIAVKNDGYINALSNTISACETKICSAI